MASAARQAWSFRYDRRGKTTGWKLGSIKPEEAMEGEPLVATLDDHDTRMEWYRAAVEFYPDEDPADARDRAEDLARAEFQRHHPEAYLVD
jgi:hypothetical protein